MSFGGGFSAFGSGAPGSGFGGAAQQAGNVREDKELQEISTENLGFLALKGSAKVKLLPASWPTDQLPPSTSSLLTIASGRGILAAAGNEVVVVSNTKAVRTAFQAPGDDVKSFSPELTIPIGIRLSHLAFSSDETCLVAVAETAGGLACYNVAKLLQGDTNFALEMATNENSVRALVPNPAPETAHLFAIVTTNGDLMVANLKNQQFSGQGNVLRSNATSVSWSKKGKQLVAGLADGSAQQLTPEGAVKKDIPRPPGLAANWYVASISWLANELFLMSYANGEDKESADFEFYFLNATKDGAFIYQKVPAPCDSFGMARAPPSFFTCRLQSLPPHIEDMIITTSSCSTDIGILTKSSSPLATDAPTNEYTTTGIADDSRKAQMPMNDNTEDTSPVGMALDFSADEKVPRPIAGSDMDETQTPLPALMALNNEGWLMAWWIVYNDAVQQGLRYPNESSAPVPTTPSSAQVAKPAQPAFGGSAWGASPAQPAFGSTSSITPAFGSTSSITPAFGQASSPAKPAFGQSAFGAPQTGGAVFGSSGLANKASPWGVPATASTASPVQPAFGSLQGQSTPTPAFGQSSMSTTPATGGTAFGSVGGIGNRGSVWGAGAAAAPAFGQGSAFGQRSTMGQAGGFASAVAATTTPDSSAGGFGKFASKSGFAAAATSDTPSFFGSAAANKPITGLTRTEPDSFGSKFGQSTPQDVSMATTPQPQTSQQQNVFGAPGFSLGSAFKADPKQAESKEADNKGPSFSGAFGMALDSSSKPAEVPKFGSNLFGNKTPSLFGLPKTVAPSPQTPAKPLDFGIKSEPNEDNVLQSIPDAPLPPESTSKTTYQPGDSSVSSLGTPPITSAEPVRTKPLADDAPLPPDFTVTKSKPVDDAPLPPDFTRSKPKAVDDAPLPPDFGPAKSKMAPEDAPLPPDFAPFRASKPAEPASTALPDDEGLPDSEPEDLGEAEKEYRREDSANDLSPSEASRTPKMTPQSSFGVLSSFGSNAFSQKLPKPPTSGPNSNLSSTPSSGTVSDKAPQSNKSAPRPLFGEVPSASASFDENTSKSFQSLPSPTPMREQKGAITLRTERGPQWKPNVEAQLQATPSFKQPARMAEPEPQQEEFDEVELSDEEYEQVQGDLEAEIEPTLTLDPLLAHKDYIGSISKEGVVGQIERLYRDVNSMVDTLGLNLRSLKSWTQGNEQFFADEGRTRDDLQHPEDWTLVEIDELEEIEDDLAKTLEETRVKNTNAKISVCKELEREATKLRVRRLEIKKILDSHSDPEQIALHHNAPLTTQQAVQQLELRREYAQLQKKLAEAEEAISLLRAKLAAHDAESNSSQATPTVDAVISTINRMTAMAEKKSGDIDMLEASLRKMRVGSPARNSKIGSPLATPQSNRLLRSVLGPRSTPGSTGSKQMFFTPESPSLRRSVMGTPSGSTPGSMREVIDSLTDDDVELLKEKARRRKLVGDKLKAALADREYHERRIA